MNKGVKQSLVKYKIIIAVQSIIIVAIILFTVIIVIENGSAETCNISGMDSQMIQTFNAQFEDFEGENQKGVDIKLLIASVNSNNGTIEQGGAGVYVEIVGTEDISISNNEEDAEFDVKGNSHPGDYSSKVIKSSSIYDVEITERTEGGLIRQITINKSN